MNWKRILLIIIGIALIAVVVIKLKSNKNVTQDKVYHYDKEQALNVQADTIQLQKIGGESTFTGTFAPNKETKLSAEMQGKVNSVFVDMGSSVKKGQTLIQLDNSLLKLQLESIEVKIEGLEADVKRFTILSNADAIQGVQLEKTELGLRTAKIQKATLEEQISKTTVRSPFSGIITAKLTEEGAFAAPGRPLLQITDIARLKFVINVPESDLKLFQINQSYTLSADVDPENSMSGKVTMIGSKANMGSSFPIQFSLNNTSDLKIKAGMFGKVIKTANGTSSESNKMGFIIPAASVQGSADQAQVYLIKEGKAVLQNISISKRMQNKVLVAKGLQGGDVLITKGFITLFEGANVSLN